MYLLTGKHSESRSVCHSHFTDTVYCICLMLFFISLSLYLQVLNKWPNLQDVSKLYISEESKMEMLDAINTTIEESIDKDICYSDYLGLIVDESTDITIHMKLCVSRLAKRRQILIFPRTAGNTGNSWEILVIPGNYWEICPSPIRKF